MTNHSKIPNAQILVIDDDLNILNVIKLLFQSYEPEYQIETLNNPSMALSQINERVPDLIITDWEMPEINGIDLIKQFRKISSLKSTPIIMTTGVMTSNENLMLALEAGANDFVRKPFEKIEFIARVRSMLQLSKFINEIEDNNLIINEHSKFVNSLISAVPEPLIYFNKEGIILGLNNKFKEIFGNDHTDFIGNSIFYLFDNFNQIKLQTENLLKKNSRHTRFELIINTPNKGNSVFLVSVTAYINSKNEPEVVICIMSDITEMKKMHENSLEEKKHELISSTMRLIQMTEINHKILKDLEMLSSQLTIKGKESVRKLKSKYNLSSIESTWEEFEFRFNRVYEDFYRRLVELHPDISPGEKKLCALLRLNLSTKDIAILTFQDMKSIDMARYRLRKKLKLAQEDNLVSYVMNI